VLHRVRSASIASGNERGAQLLIDSLINRAFIKDNDRIYLQWVRELVQGGLC